MRDIDVRKAVRQRLFEEHFGEGDTAVIEEMGIWSGSARIDIAVVNGELSGYELKSDRDTLQRLPHQVELYSKVFDKVTLVVGSRHAANARTYIPNWWGILVATQSDSGISLRESRRPRRNPSPDPYLVAQLLWKDEAISLLDRYGLARGWRAKKIRAIHERLASEFPFDVLSAHVRETLKRRPEWLRQVMPSNLDMSVNTDLHPVL